MSKTYYSCNKDCHLIGGQWHTIKEAKSMNLLFIALENCINTLISFITIPLFTLKNNYVIYSTCIYRTYGKVWDTLDIVVI